MSKVWVSEFGEFRLVVTGNDVVVMDVQTLKDSVVEFSPTRVGGLPVLLLGVAQDEQAPVEDRDEAVTSHGGLREDTFGWSVICCIAAMV